MPRLKLTRPVLIRQVLAEIGVTVRANERAQFLTKDELVKLFTYLKMINNKKKLK